jgi:recombination protein RecT
MNTTSNAPAVQDKAAIETAKKDITAQVLGKIELFQKSGELRLPSDYSAENALKSAYLILLETQTSDKKPVLEACTRESIANSLLKMVVWGLSPLKKQCDFIAYGNTLQCNPEYTGNIVLAKRYGGLQEINGNAVFKGDEFAFENDVQTGRKRVIKHTQSLDTFGSKDIVGAYAVMTFKDGTTKTEIMTMPQIRQSWEQGATKGNSPAHRNFPDQMAVKTVINRACKSLIRSSDDAVLYSDSKDVQDVEYVDVSDTVAAEIAQKANAGEPLSFEPSKQPDEISTSMPSGGASPAANAESETKTPPQAGEQSSRPQTGIPF